MPDMSEKQFVTVTIRIEEIQNKTYNIENEEIPMIILKGRDINGKKITAHIRYTMANALNNRLNNVLLPHIPLEKQTQIIRLQGENVKHSFIKNNSPIIYYRLEAQNFSLENGANLELLRNAFKTEEDKRKDLKTWHIFQKLKDEGQDIQAYKILENYMIEKINMIEENKTLNQQLDNDENSMPLKM
jgi:hypothetical protein